MFALVDCNNFYASCERVFRPELNGKPIVVLSNNDGCVIARSNEAKSLGITMGTPAFKFKESFKANGVNVFSSNYALYGDMSKRVMDLLSKFTPNIEVYSIDEAFLKFELVDSDFTTLGHQIRKVVTKGSGIPVSIGFGPTKALAKLANKIAKKDFLKTHDVFVIDSEECRQSIVKHFPIDKVWGIGGQHAQRLKGLGIYSVHDFISLPDKWVHKNMSVVGLRIKHELMGISRLDLELPTAKKNIATARSFERNYTKLDDLEERVSTFASICAAKLRKQKSCCSAVMVFIHTNAFKQNLNQYSRNIVMQLPNATNSSFDLVKTCLDGLRKIYKPNHEYKKAGVIVLDIVPDNPQQLGIYQNLDDRHKSLMSAMDKLNFTYGQQLVKLASQDLKRTWKMKQEMLSPRYSTRLSDVIKVKV